MKNKVTEKNQSQIHDISQKRLFPEAHWDPGHAILGNLMARPPLACMGRLFELEKRIPSSKHSFGICHKVAYNSWWGWCFLEYCALNNLCDCTWRSCLSEPCQILPGGALGPSPGITIPVEELSYQHWWRPLRQLSLNTRMGTYSISWVTVCQKPMREPSDEHTSLKEQGSQKWQNLQHLTLLPSVPPVHEGSLCSLRGVEQGQVLWELPTVQRQWKEFRSLTAPLALRSPARIGCDKNFLVTKTNPWDGNSHVNNKSFSDKASPEEGLPGANSRQWFSILTIP